MKLSEILKILETYETESEKGFYSYQLSNGSVTVSRRSEPNREYSFSRFRPDRVLAEVLAQTEDPDVLFWKLAEDELSVEDLPDADDWFITDGVFYPYACMIRIDDNAEEIPVPEWIFKDFNWRSPSKINEKRPNLAALNILKNVVSAQEDFCRHRRSGLPLDEKVPPFGENTTDCFWAGAGYNDYDLAVFRFKGIEFSVSAPKNVSLENRNRRRFREQEWLFPYVSNGVDEDRALYVRTASLLKYEGKALEKKKKETRDALRTLLDVSGIRNYETIEIRSVFKKRPE